MLKDATLYSPTSITIRDQASEIIRHYDSVKNTLSWTSQSAFYFKKTRFIISSIYNSILAHNRRIGIHCSSYKEMRDCYNLLNQIEKLPADKPYNFSKLAEMLSDLIEDLKTNTSKYITKCEIDFVSAVKLFRSKQPDKIIVLNDANHKPSHPANH